MYGNKSSGYEIITINITSDGVEYNCLECVYPSCFDYSIDLRRKYRQSEIGSFPRDQFLNILDHSADLEILNKIKLRIDFIRECRHTEKFGGKLLFPVGCKNVFIAFLSIQKLFFLKAEIVYPLMWSIDNISG